MNGARSKVTRRAIRRSFGEPAAVLVGAHEEGLRSHGEMLRVVILGPFWRRFCWLLLGPRITFWLFTKRESNGET
jgi:hypothetical protein